MARNKARLQLALYARPKHPGTFHYALLVASKDDTGPVIKHHALNTLYINSLGEAVSPWRYEQATVADMQAEHRLLARVTIAKVADPPARVGEVLKTVPVHQAEYVDTTENKTFSCWTWVRDAFEELRSQGAVASKLEHWDEIQSRATEYVTGKREQGRWETTWKGAAGVPLLDLLTGKELVA